MRYTFFLIVLACAYNVFSQDSAKKLDASFQCTVVFAQGTFWGYGVVEEGNTVSLDLARLDEFEGSIEFESESDVPAYIPLPGPLVVEELEHYSSSELQRVRLTSTLPSKSTHERRKLTLDFQRAGGRGKGSNYFSLWIVGEYPGINSVAYVDCWMGRRDG